MLTEEEKAERRHAYYLANKHKWKEYRERHKQKIEGIRYLSENERKISFGLRRIFGKSPNVDGIIGVPCFGCEQRICNPNTCRKLTEWIEKST